MFSFIYPSLIGKSNK